MLPGPQGAKKQPFIAERLALISRFWIGGEKYYPLALIS